jgi:CBS domain-containing protein
MSPLLDHVRKAMVALSLLIAAGVISVIVVDRQGRVEGVITIADISDQLTTGPAPPPGPDPEPAEASGAAV